MDPDGTIYFAINLIISILLCLYIASSRIDEDFEDFEIGMSKSLISALILLIANVGVFSALVLPKFTLVFRCVFGALFILLGVVLPYCVGIAKHENAEGFKKILNPVITLLNYTVTAVLVLPVMAVFKLFKLKPETVVTQEDVMELVEDASDEIIDDERKEMIENIFELSDINVGEIMTHRTEVFAIDQEEICKDVINDVRCEGFSRIPVYSNNIDTVTGVLFAKDLLNVIDDEKKLNQPVKSIARKAMFVPQSCAANDLLVQFKLKRMQMAVVVDEYGGTSGIVTMEDVLEEIVGNIQDEYDNEEEEFTKVSDTVYILSGTMNIDDALEIFDKERSEEEEQNEDYDTVSGMIIDNLARIPENGENASVEYNGILFTVMAVEDRRITKVKAEKLAEEINEDDKD